MAGGEAGNVISKLFVGQTTQNGSVNCSTEPLGAHWEEELANKEIQKRSIFGHIPTQKYKNELAKMQFYSNRDKIIGREAGNTS